MDANGWNARYTNGRVWSVEANRFFSELVGELDAPPGRALDLACGEGRNAVWLAQRGWTVTAVDFSEVGIERSRRGAAEVGVEVEWVIADLADWDLGEGCWDLVAHVYLHWPTGEREPFLRRCAAALAPGGHLIVVGHDRTNIADGHGGPQDPDVLTTPEEMTALLVDAGLRVITATTVLREVTLAPAHDTDEPSTADAIDHVLVAVGR